MEAFVICLQGQIIVFLGNTYDNVLLNRRRKTIISIVCNFCHANTDFTGDYRDFLSVRHLFRVREEVFCLFFNYFFWLPVYIFRISRLKSFGRRKLRIRIWAKELFRIKIFKFNLYLLILFCGLFFWCSFSSHFALWLIMLILLQNLTRHLAFTSRRASFTLL